MSNAWRGDYRCTYYLNSMGASWHSPVVYVYLDKCATASE